MNKYEKETAKQQRLELLRKDMSEEAWQDVVRTTEAVKQAIEYANKEVEK